MALRAKLQQKQTQSLVLTPQLLQSIRLLQLGNLELAAYLERELEKNPLLEIAEDRETGPPAEVESADPDSGEGSATVGEELEVSREAMEHHLDTSLENVFDSDLTAGVQPPATDSWSGQSARQTNGAEGADNLDSYCAAPMGMSEHLEAQIAGSIRDNTDAFIARQIIHSLEDDGYLRRPLEEIATQLGVSETRCRTVLQAVQTLDPAGIAARDLSECLGLQLQERNRLDPAMQLLLSRLDLLARRDYASLSRLCGLAVDEVVDMAAEIRELDPRPGARFAAESTQVAVPDVIVTARSDGGWAIELNDEVLPKVLVNRAYYARVAAHCQSEADKTFMVDCLQSANWLVKSLDQRARTILKVAAEIVKQQDAFLLLGIEHLRPLTLRSVASAIRMHESTVSRVTSNKYMMTPRGLFELKYFFTAPIASATGSEAHSAESVRHRIRQLVESETPDRILSDDTIVTLLHKSGIEIARRTVAKYRESLSIPSSVQRRREKQAAQARPM